MFRHSYINILLSCPTVSMDSVFFTLLYRYKSAKDRLRFPERNERFITEKQTSRDGLTNIAEYPSAVLLEC